MVSWCVACKCHHNTKDKNLSLTLPRNGKTVKIWKNIKNFTDLPKIIALCKKHFHESYFDKCVNLRRRQMNSKDEFMFNFAFDF